MDKKAQIAMETLMIYGITILVVMLAIGALIYFGVLNLGGLLPDRCQFEPSVFTCTDYQATYSDTPANNQIIIELTNNVGKGIQVNGLSLNPEGTSVVDGTTSATIGTNPSSTTDPSSTSYTWPNGQTSYIVVSQPVLSPGDKTDVEVTIEYNYLGKTLTHKSSGVIKVEAKE